MRYLRRGVFLLLWAAAFLTGVHGLDYLYVERGDSDWGRILWHNYYAQERNIDCLYLGSSHVHCDINPFMLDARNGKNNFNLTSAGQLLNGSYYLLREADRRHDLEHVYLEMYYVESTGWKGIYDENVVNNWYNTDYMRPSFNKLQYMLTMSSPEQYAETLLPFLRFRSKLFDYEYVGDMIRHKGTEDYRDFVVNTLYEDGSATHYADKGYYETSRQLAESGLCWTDADYRMEEEPLTEDAERYLRKILEYCQAKRIGITLFSSPMYELQVLSTEHYDRYVEQVERIAAEYGIAYYDFNLCREEVLPIQKTENFMDIGHLNSTGAALYTPVFWQVMSGTAEENKAYFYSSYAEKLRETPPRIYGIYYIAAEEADACIDAVAAAAECEAAVMNVDAAADGGDMEEDSDFRATVYRVAANRPQDLEYRITLTPSADEETAETEDAGKVGGEPADEGGREQAAVECLDFSANPYFAIPENTHGTCTVAARVRGQESVLQTLEIAY